MAPADAYDILYYASKALREYASTNAWLAQLHIIAFGLAKTRDSNTMDSYWQSIITYAAGAGGRTYTVAGKVYGPNPHDFCDSVGIHPYSSADPATPSPTQAGTPIQTSIPAIRAVMDTNGGSTKTLYITEWGWRGSNTASTNTYNGGTDTSVLWEDEASESSGQGSQERWERGGLYTLMARPEWKIKAVHHFRVFDNGGNSSQYLGIAKNVLAGGANGPASSANWKKVGTAINVVSGADPFGFPATADGVVHRASSLHYFSGGIDT